MNPGLPRCLRPRWGGELPGEVESLIFCVQTGIGVGVIAFYGPFCGTEEVDERGTG